MGCFPVENIVNHFLYKPPPRKEDKNPFSEYKGVAYTYIKNASKNLIIWSHGNADHIETIFSKVKNVSNYVNSDFLLYDYPGYGYTDGVPNEDNMIATLENIVKFAIIGGYEPKNIILLGYSLGTGVVSKYVAVKGWEGRIILISPFKSILRLGIDIKWLCDYYETIENITRVECPVKVYHGAHDSTVPLKNGVDVYSVVKNKKYEMKIIENAIHTDMIEKINWADFSKEMDL